MMTTLRDRLGKALEAFMGTETKTGNGRSGDPNK